MTEHLWISRRQLIVGGLLVAFASSARAIAATSEATGPSAIGGFVRISQEGGISLVMPSVEMGQGIYTAEAALLAEELDVRLDQIVAIAAPPDASLYAQPLFKAQMTGGSTSIRGFWTPLRQAGAAARSMLVAAAAQAWGVHPDECSTMDGTILHSSTGRVLKYEEVAESAAELASFDVMGDDGGGVTLLPWKSGTYEVSRSTGRTAPMRWPRSRSPPSRC